MKKKLTALTLLAVAAGTLVLAGCDDTPSSNDSGDTTSSVEAWATSVRVTQPGTLVVGETYKLSENVTANGGTKYTVAITSGDGTVIKLENDGDTVTVVGAGTATIQIRGASDKVLGNVSFKTLTENGKALQEFCDSLSNNFMVDCVWGEIETTWAKASEGQAYDYSEGLGLIVTENYILDAIYSVNYSAVALEKAGGAAYGYTLLDANGNELDYGNLGVEGAVKNAASVKLGSKVSGAYITDYFVMDGLLDVLDYTEGDGGYFTLNDGSQSAALVGNLLGMSTSSYTGVSAKVKLENNVLNGIVKFDYKGQAGCALEFTLKKDFKVSLLEDAVKNSEAPAALDVTDLADHYATFSNNYAMNWEIGVYDSSFSPVEGFYKYNTVGTTLYYTDSIIMAYAGRDETTGEITDCAIMGYVNGDDGIYSVVLGNDNVIAKGDLASNKSTNVYDFFATGADFTKTALEAASLTLIDSGTTTSGVSYKQYTYDASFDTLGLMGICEKTLPTGYEFADDEDNAIYCAGLITDYGTQINGYFYERVKLSSTTSGLQGYKTIMYGAGNVTDVIGKKSWEAFPGYFTDPSAATGE